MRFMLVCSLGAVLGLCACSSDTSTSRDKGIKKDKAKAGDSLVEDGPGQLDAATGPDASRPDRAVVDQAKLDVAADVAKPEVSVSQ